MSFWPLYICSCYTSVTSHDITWLSHDCHMMSHDTATNIVLTWPSKIRLMVSGMEGVFHLFAFSFCKGGRKATMSNRSLLIQRREVQSCRVKRSNREWSPFHPPQFVFLALPLLHLWLTLPLYWGLGILWPCVCVCVWGGGGVWYQMRCTNQFGRCVHAFLSVSLSLDWSEKTEGVEELGLLEGAKRRETQHL